MEKKRKGTHRRFSDEFRLEVLKDFYESGLPRKRIARKYDIDSSQIVLWIKFFEEKRLSSSDQNIIRLITMAKAKREAQEMVLPKSTEELLREENERLKKALQYSELRNEALHEVLKIGKEQYGVDLLKKVGVKQ